MQYRKRFGFLAVIGLLTLSGCATIGLQQPPPAAPGMVAQLVLPAEGTGSVSGLLNYNFYSPNPLTSTWLYEPLMIRDQFTCDLVPWLATGYKWTDSKTLVLTIRDGVKFSDGTTLTGADVAFSLNAAKTYPGADKYGIWTPGFGAPAQSVRATGNTVTVTFTGPAAAKLDSVVQQRIVPEHVYGKVGDITKYIDASPDGTGPYKVGTYNGRRLTLVRRDDYWQADKIKVEQLALEGSYDSNSAALKLRTSGLDIYLGDIPNPEKSVAAAGKTQYYYSPQGITVLTPNVSRFPDNDMKFRTALAFAIDKDQISRKATFGVMGKASQTMLKLPVQQKLLPAQYQADGGYIPFDPAKAEQMLDAAGYKKGADGFRTGPQGQKLSLTFSVQAGYIDYLAMADVIVRILQAIGIDIHQVATDPNAVDNQKKTGDFDMLLDAVDGGCARARSQGGKLTTDQIPTDKDLLLNVARYKDSSADALVSDYLTASDPAQQKADGDKLSEIFYTQMPYIALVYAPQRLIYRTAAASGWPSPDHPYPTDQMLYVLTHLGAPS